MKGHFVLSLLLTISLLDACESRFLYHMDLVEDHKQAIVDAHNHFRRLVNPEAANMRLMTWDVELEAFSLNFVSKCSFKHTSNRDLFTSVFRWIGENLYTGGKLDFSQIMTREGVTKLWFDEIDDWNYDTSSCSGKMCGHYTQVAWANSYKLGCAIGNCASIAEGGTPPILVACHYGPGGNLVDNGVRRNPYVSGTPCSQCGEGDLCIDGLCNNTARDIPFTTTTQEPTMIATTEATTPVLTTPVLTTAESFTTTTNKSGANATVTECTGIYDWLDQYIDICTENEARRICNNGPLTTAMTVFGFVYFAVIG